MKSAFSLKSDFKPQGDQNQAIQKLTKSIQHGNPNQTLLGVTGSGKTFSMANIIANVNMPTLILCHNKTLAAQLYSEFKAFFPKNAVEYFISYFDFYQPEAYIPRTDTFIEKDSSVNEDIERLRLATMGALLSRKDVIVVASVSCIYGLGDPEDYKNQVFSVFKEGQIERDEILKRLVQILYERNDIEFSRGKFRVRGDTIDVFPAYLENEAIRIELFGDVVEKITMIDPLTAKTIKELDTYLFYPAKQFITSKDKITMARHTIQAELKERLEYFEKNDLLVEAQRIKQRTDYDLEMMQELGYCNGIENYSRHLTGRDPGDTPNTLFDFFENDFLVIVDESHTSLPQIQGMHAGDKSRKSTLIDHGFRLPSAIDNRPLNFKEFMNITHQRLFVSATPANFEFINSRAGIQENDLISLNDAKLLNTKNIKISNSHEAVDDFDYKTKNNYLIVEQIIRPTGLLDPILEIKPLDGQIDETIELCRQNIEKNERVLITTLTKKTAENLSTYLQKLDLKVNYMHSDIDAIERVEILRALRNAEIDILIGINLLREGLDLPEVSLVCILDADKEGFLRSSTSLIQTAGRAARHENGRVVLFADKITKSIQALIDVTNKRRTLQIAHNTKHNITPQSVKRTQQHSLQEIVSSSKSNKKLSADKIDYLNVIKDLEGEMAEASQSLEFERAALLRDQIKELKNASQKTS